MSLLIDHAERSDVHSIRCRHLVPHTIRGTNHDLIDVAIWTVLVIYGDDCRITGTIVDRNKRIADPGVNVKACDAFFQDCWKSIPERRVWNHEQTAVGCFPCVIPVTCIHDQVIAERCHRRQIIDIRNQRFRRLIDLTIGRALIHDKLGRVSIVDVNQGAGIREERISLNAHHLGSRWHGQPILCRGFGRKDLTRTSEDRRSLGHRNKNIIRRNRKLVIGLSRKTLVLRVQRPQRPVGVPVQRLNLVIDDRHRRNESRTSAAIIETERRCRDTIESKLTEHSRNRAIAMPTIGETDASGNTRNLVGVLVRHSWRRRTDATKIRLEDRSPSIPANGQRFSAGGHGHQRP